MKRPDRVNTRDISLEKCPDDHMRIENAKNLKFHFLAKERSEEVRVVRARCRTISDERHEVGEKEYFPI